MTVTNKDKVTSLRTLDMDGAAIRIDDANHMLCLTDMWKAAGSAKNKKPVIFMRTDAFVEITGEMEKVTPHHLLVRMDRGRNGGTWTHQDIAIAYAKYLSPKFHVWALKAVRERIEEEQNPELGIQRSRDRAIASWRRKGMSEEWISNRVRGIDTRNVLSSFISKRCPNEKNPHGVVTNAMYVGAFGQTAAELRESRGLPAKANVREDLTANELMIVMLAESATVEKADKERVYGRDMIAALANRAGRKISDAYESFMNESLYI